MGPWFLPFLFASVLLLYVKVAHCQAKHQITRALLLLLSQQQGGRALFVYFFTQAPCAGGRCCMCEGVLLHTFFGLTFFFNNIRRRWMERVREILLSFYKPLPVSHLNILRRKAARECVRVRCAPIAAYVTAARRCISNFSAVLAELIFPERISKEFSPAACPTHNLVPIYCGLRVGL
jgi:hypothetical protein